MGKKKSLKYNKFPKQLKGIYSINLKSHFLLLTNNMSNINKTLIGKNGYLFLINDSANELKVHCENLDLVKDKTLSRYNFNKFVMVVLPNKSLMYKDFLPDEYNVKYRPAFDIYQNKFKNKIIDAYEILKYEDDTYYKTDTHINLKGNYIIYQKFINKINQLFDLNMNPRNINILHKSCQLSTLDQGIGDLTWSTNLGDQQLESTLDNYYFTNDFERFYNKYVIKNDKEIRFLNYELVDETEILENKNEFAHWNIISKYVIYKKNIDNVSKNKIIIFYDSFLLNILPLYLELFYEIYMIKQVYDSKFINLIKPDYVFEFRAERFLF